MILSIETSVNTVINVSILSDNNQIISKSVLCNNNGSELILQLIDDVLKESGIDINDINIIINDVGPGSFTGIRIGVNTVNGLSYNNNIKTFGISSLDIIGFISKRFEYSCSVIKAGRGEIYNAVYNYGKRISDYLCSDKESIVNYKSLYPGIVFTGELFDIDGNTDIIETIPDSETMLKMYPDYVTDNNLPMYLQVSQAEEFLKRG